MDDYTVTVSVSRKHVAIAGAQEMDVAIDSPGTQGLEGANVAIMASQRNVVIAGIGLHVAVNSDFPEDT